MDGNDNLGEEEAGPAEDVEDNLEDNGLGFTNGGSKLRLQEIFQIEYSKQGA